MDEVLMRIRNQCVRLCDENNYSFKSYPNGVEKHVGDLMFWGLITEDANDLNKPLRLCPINYESVGKDYMFVRFLDDNKPDNMFNFPILQGNIKTILVSDLSEFDYYC